MVLEKWVQFETHVRGLRGRRRESSFGNVSARFAVQHECHNKNCKREKKKYRRVKTHYKTWMEWNPAAEKIFNPNPKQIEFQMMNAKKIVKHEIFISNIFFSYFFIARFTVFFFLLRFSFHENVNEVKITWKLFSMNKFMENQQNFRRNFVKNLFCASCLKRRLQ